MNEQQAHNLMVEVDTICTQRFFEKSNRLGVVSRINKAKFAVGIMGRNNSAQASELRQKIADSYPNLLTKKEYWG